MILIFFKELNFLIFVQNYLTNIFILTTFICIYIFFKKKTLCFFILIIFINNVNNLVPGLQNSLFKIHPIMFFFCLILFLLKKSNKSKIYFTFFLSLFLGGFWATQEFNWGGWWNWDLIETPTLYISFIIINQIHTNLNTSIYFFEKYNFLKKYSSFSIVYFYPKIITLNSVHSFINNFNFFLFFFIKLYSKTLLVLVLFWLPLTLFGGLKSFFFLKYLLLYLMFFFVLKIYKNKKINLTTHIVYTNLLLFFILYNFKKIFFYKNFKLIFTNKLFFIKKSLSKLYFTDKNHINFNVFWEKYNFSHKNSFLFFFKKSIIF